jgi:hypothetical protein
LKRQIDVYRRTLRVLSLVLAVTCSHRAFAQEGAVTRLDLPIGRAYPYRADEVITRVTVANPAIGDAIVISEREVVLNAIAPVKATSFSGCRVVAGFISACRCTPPQTGCRSRSG